MHAFGIRHYMIPACSRTQLEIATHLLADLDRTTTPSGQKNPVSRLDRDGNDGALLVGGTGTDSDDGGFRERGLGGRGGEEDTRGSFLVEALSISVSATDQAHVA